MCKNFNVIIDENHLNKLIGKSLANIVFTLCFLASLNFSNILSAQSYPSSRCGSVNNVGQNEAVISGAQAVSERAVITIPVVVHVVWNQSPENISDEQIQSQIEVLNQDFRADNIEVPNIPSVFQPLVADTELEFCLAKVDPDGNPTAGITRTFTQNSVGIGGSSSIHYTAQGGQDAWDTERYLNIWVAKFAGGVGGIATFPGQGEPAEDGVEIDYRQFGTVNLEPPYHLGRTCTHEIGHYLNLEHPWGPSFNDCCEDDFVADTPEACETYFGQCPTHPVVSCSEPDMFMNFMFYTDDECMGMFTLGQKARMLATLNSSRSGLLIGGICDPSPTGEAVADTQLKVLKNPTAGSLEFEIISEKPGMWKFELIDRLGRSMAGGEILARQAQVVEVQYFPKGMYFLKIEREGQIAVERVLVF